MHDGLFFYKSFTLFSIIRVDIKMLLHRWYHFITVIKNETVSFNSLSDTYKDDDDLGIFRLHNEFLVKGTLCIPKTSFQEYLIRKHHSDGLATHHDKDKTIQSMKERYFWSHENRHSWVCQAVSHLSNSKRNFSKYRSLHVFASLNQHLRNYKHRFYFGTTKDSKTNGYRNCSCGQVL